MSEFKPDDFVEAAKYAAWLQTDEADKLAEKAVFIIEKAGVNMDINMALTALLYPKYLESKKRYN